MFILLGIHDFRCAPIYLKLKCGRLISETTLELPGLTKAFYLKQKLLK